MKNRAKCKLCNSIVESFHSADYAICKCGEIAVDGGDAMRAFAKDWGNFLRIDDEGNIIIPKIIEKREETSETQEFPKPSRAELISMLDDLIKSYENLPQHAMLNPINHYDLTSVMMVISQILKAKD